MFWVRHLQRNSRMSHLTINTKDMSVNTVFVRRYTPRRSLLYVPGDDNRKLNKAFKIDVDCITMDCEDGVALNKKGVARETIRGLLNKGKPNKDRKYDWAVRANSVDSGFCKEDLLSVLTARNLPDTILLPKVDSVEHLEWFAEQVNSLIVNKENINLILYVESALGLINLPVICEKADKLSKSSKFTLAGLVFGSDDFCADIGATRTEDSSEILYARQKVVLYAKAYNLQAIDMVYIQYKDLEGLQKQAEQGAKMGYTGKQVIHPAQVPVVQEAFLPSKQRIEWTSGLITAFEQHQKLGQGAFTYNGIMIDMPTMKQAQNVMEIVNSVK